MKKGSDFLKMIGYVLLYMIIWFGAIMGFRFLFSMFWGNESSRKVIDLLANKWGLGVLLYFGIPVLIYFLILKWRKENFAEFCRFKKMTGKDTLIVFLITMAGIIFTTHLINISFCLNKFPEFDEYLKNNISAGNPFGVLIMIGLLMPACEEILFRGMIFGEMRRRLPLVVVLLTHTLLYMPFQPNSTIAAYAYLNFTIYALVYIFTDSIWGSILMESIGAFGLYGIKMLKLDLIIRGLGDTYLIIVTIVSLTLLFVGTFALRKAPLKEIFSRRTGTDSLTPGV